MERYLLGNYFDPIDSVLDDMTHRWCFIKIMQWVGAPVLYFYSALFFYMGLNFAATMILMAGLNVSFGSLWILRYDPQERQLPVYRVMVALFFSCMLLHHINLIGFNNRLDFIGWLCIYPPLIFFSLGDRAGIIWGLTSLVAVLTTFLVQKPWLITESLLLNLKIQTLIALSTMGLIAYVIENVGHRTLEERISQKFLPS